MLLDNMDNTKPTKSCKTLERIHVLWKGKQFLFCRYTCTVYLGEKHLMQILYSLVLSERGLNSVSATLDVSMLTTPLYRIVNIQLKAYDIVWTTFIKRIIRNMSIFDNHTHDDISMLKQHWYNFR